MPWDGVERRATHPSSPSLTSVKEELESVKGALMIVAEGMHSFVSSDDLDKRIKHEKQQQRKLFAAVIFAAIIGFMSVVANTFQLKDLHDRSVRNRVANAYSQRLTLSAVNCIIYQLDLHRQANEFAHQRITGALKVPYDEPADLVPQPPTDELIKSCDVLRNALVQGGGD